MWKWVLGIVAAALCVLAAASWVLWQRWTRDPLAELPGYVHEGAESIAVARDGRWVVTRDRVRRIRAFETATGNVTDVANPTDDGQPHFAPALAFSDGGYLLGERRSDLGEVALLVIRAGRWERVVIPPSPPSPPAARGSPPPVLTDRIEACVVGPGGCVLVRTSRGRDFAWSIRDPATGSVEGPFPDPHWSLDDVAATPDGLGVVALQSRLVLRIDLRSGRLLWRSDPFATGLPVASSADLDSVRAHVDFALARRDGASFANHMAILNVLGTSEDGSRVVLRRKELSAALARLVDGGAFPSKAELTTNMEIVALDGTTGAPVWRRDVSCFRRDAFLGPQGTVLVVEDDALRLLDLEDGRDVTPARWPGRRLGVEAAAPEADGRGLWVALRDGRVRRVEVPELRR